MVKGMKFSAATSMVYQSEEHSYGYNDRFEFVYVQRNGDFPERELMQTLSALASEDPSGSSIDRT